MASTGALSSVGCVEDFLEIRAGDVVFVDGSVGADVNAATACFSSQRCVVGGEVSESVVAGSGGAVGAGAGAGTGTGCTRSGLEVVAGPLTASFWGARTEPGSAVSDANEPGAGETGSGLGETVESSIDDCTGNAADALSEDIVGADVGYVVGIVEAVGL